MYVSKHFYYRYIYLFTDLQIVTRFAYPGITEFAINTCEIYDFKDFSSGIRDNSWMHNLSLLALCNPRQAVL